MTTYTMAIIDREGRDCDAHEIIRQIGKMNTYAICGGVWASLRDSTDQNRIIGAWLHCGTSRAVEVILDWNDTYIVRRVRRITRGADRNNGVVEFEQREVYCDELAEVAYRASCWR
jgi:hypothetical protein